MSLLIEESEALHARVRAFARQSLAGAAAESFDVLAADIARYQAAHVDGFRRLVDASGSSLTDSTGIPAVPVDAFRLTRVAVHPKDLDVVRFVTSGTTSGAPGTHAMRSTETYRELSLAWGVPALRCAAVTPRIVVALAPDPGPDIASSLAFMMRALMQTLDGRSLRDGDPAHFDSDAGERWLLGPDGPNLAGLERAAAIARERHEPLVVLSTSFALVLLADAREATFDAPEGSVVMTTGGFKGKTREIAPETLEERVTALFGVPAARIIGEYGMTELTSQLYEGAPNARDVAPASAGSGLPFARGVFYPPPWLRVTPVDPESLAPVEPGETGIARFVDLGNVDSAVAIVAQDVIQQEGDGVRLLGRLTGAPARGCSLAIEEMVLGRREGT